jgi:hypothetical protein|tara:strand:- start:1187 stop:1510 length:324 start_codon:yes stop_codon:yes gene_type:complete
VEATLYDAHQVPNAYELRHEEPALRAGAMNLPPFFEAKLRTMLAEANDLQAALAQLEGAVLGGDHVGVGELHVVLQHQHALFEAITALREPLSHLMHPLSLLPPPIP